MCMTLWTDCHRDTFTTVQDAALTLYRCVFKIKMKAELALRWVSKGTESRGL